MGQAQSDPSWIHKTRIKAEFAVLAQLYTEDELEKVAKRLKDVALNFALDKSKFTKILHLPEAHLESIGTWFEEFSKDRASKMVDGLEFVAAVTCVSRKVPVFAKIRRLFHLFDLDDTNCIRKDEFIIFLKATTTGLHRMVQGLPPSPPVLQLETLAGDFFADIPGALTLSDFLVWLTETHASLHFVSCLTRLRRATWVFGRNERLQLGLHLEPHTQHRPTPLLGLEGYTVAKVATNQSHSLFLTDQGRLFSCGRGFAGILGTGDLDDRPQPVLVEALQHVRLADIAVGVRHSACVSEKGQLFTWGAADMGQLGLADDKGRYPSDPRKWAFDPTTGGLYSYVATPAVVSSLWSSQVKVRRVVCNSFSTCALSEEGRLVTAGDATEGQCGHGQMYKGYRMMHLEPHTARTASMVLDRFTTIRGPEVKDVEFVDVSGGGAHTLALDSHGSVWAWGSGQWGRLGHGDSRTCFEPRCVSVLKAHKCVQVSAGFMHSACVASIFRITITGAAGESGLSAFSILGLPVGPLDVWLEKQQPLTPPNTNIELNAFLSAPLLVVDLPLKDTTDDQFINNELYPASAIKESVLLVDRSLWEGQWLKLTTSDYDVKLTMADNTAEIPPKTGLGGKLMMPIADDKGKWEKEDCSGRICIFEMQHTTGTERDADKLSEALSTRAVEVAAAGAMACLFVCPEKMEPFTITPPEDKHADLANLPVATMSHEHGSFLKDHLLKLTADKAKQSPGGVPEEAKDWVESREEFTGRVYYHNTITGANRWAPPYVDSGTDGLLVSVKVDTFFERLQKVLKTEPKGVIVAHQSWRPDVALQDPPANGFDESLLSRVPTLQITYEAGQELKAVSGRGCEPIASMEVQPFGGVYAWGMGTQGQLALSEVERDRSMRTHENAFTGEKNSFCHSPCYVSNLHEQQVVQIQCGGTHTATVTQGGEVFSWGRGDACGAMLGDLAAMQTDGFGNKIGCVDVPIVVDQLENIAKARRIFCGDNQTFIIADMPHPPFSTPS